MDHLQPGAPGAGEETAGHPQPGGSAPDSGGRQAAALSRLPGNDLLLRLAFTGRNESARAGYRQRAPDDSRPPRQRRQRPLRPFAGTNAAVAAPVLEAASQSRAALSRRRPEPYRLGTLYRADVQEQRAGRFPRGAASKRQPQTRFRAYPAPLLGHPSAGSRRQPAA